MSIELEHGSYYSIRGAEHIDLVAHNTLDGDWWFADLRDSGTNYALRDGELFISPRYKEYGPSTGWTADDIITSFEAAVIMGEYDAINATARELLADVDIDFDDLSDPFPF